MRKLINKSVGPRAGCHQESGDIPQSPPTTKGKGQEVCFLLPQTRTRKCSSRQHSGTVAHEAQAPTLSRPPETRKPLNRDRAVEQAIRSREASLAPTRSAGARSLFARHWSFSSFEVRGKVSFLWYLEEVMFATRFEEPWKGDRPGTLTSQM